MATTKTILSEILSELKTLRTEVKQKQRTASKSPASSSFRQRQSTLPPARKLLQNIANTPKPIPKCWYHKQHGIATNPGSCPGPEFCSFNYQAEIDKMKKLIAQHSVSPIQQRIVVAPNNAPKKNRINDHFRKFRKFFNCKPKGYSLH